MHFRSWAGKRLLVFFAFLSITCLVAASAMAHGGHGHERPGKTGILVVAFGTSMPEGAVAYDHVDKRVKAAFAGIPVRWAYTSKMIRHKLDGLGSHFDSPAEALAAMMDDDFTHVAVLSLHVIPGEEYHGLVQTAHAFSGLPKGMEEVAVTAPLLSDAHGMQQAARALLSLAPGDRGRDEAVVFMGHGTHHAGNAFYPAMQYYMWQLDKLALVGTVEGSPSLDDVLAELEAKDVKKAYLLPLMAVAGDHARNDMAGDEEDSWKSVLNSKGIEPVSVLAGVAESDAVVDIWIGHLKDALSRLEH
jgi:sirohydrochlorin cobaltochelatase